MELRRKRNCMISGSEIRPYKKVTEPLFAYAGRRHENPKLT